MTQPPHGDSSPRETGRGSSIAIKPEKLVAALTLAATVLLSAHAIVVSYDILHGDVHYLMRQIVDVNDEHNLPTWFSGFILLLATGLIGVCARWKTHEKDRMRRRWNVLFWGFLFLSIDEIAGIHETINTAIDPSWAIGGAVIAFLLGIWYIPFLKSLPKRAVIGFVVAGVLYVGGAVGIEIIAEPLDSDSLAYNLSTMAEEGMEMFGVIVFLRTLLLYMRDQGAHLFSFRLV